MKQSKQAQITLRIGLFLVIIGGVYRCTAQEIRLSTSSGLVIARETNNQDEICLLYGGTFQEVRTEHLHHAGTTLKQRLASALRMADDAGVPYRVFLRENAMPDGALAHAYYAKCQELRLQFLAILPERAFLEIRHTMQYF